MRAPYGQQPDPNHNARLLLGLIPEDVRKSASAGELNARLAEARRLGEQANDLGLDPLLRSQARAMAQQVLTAPRSAAPVQKALAREQAGQLADEAAARAIAKGKARRVAKAARSGEKAAMQAVFDQDGQLVGVVPADAIQPVSGAAAAPPAQAAAPAAAPPAPAAPGQVAKGDEALVQQVIKSLGAGKWLPAHDWTGRPVGIVKRKRVTPLPAGQVLKGSAASTRANVYTASRRRIGTAKLGDIVSMSELRAARGQAGR